MAGGWHQAQWQGRGGRRHAGEGQGGSLWIPSAVSRSDKRHAAADLGCDWTRGHAIEGHGTIVCQPITSADVSQIRETTVSGQSTDVFGRVLCSARTHHFVVDGPVANGCPG